MASDNRGEVLIEMIQMGNTVKVVAVDPASGTEVSIVGPMSAGEEMLKRNAIRKLDYVMRKQAGSQPRR